MPGSTNAVIISKYNLFAQSLALVLRKIGYASVATINFDKAAIVTYLDKDSTCVVLLKSDVTDEQSLKFLAEILSVASEAKVLVLGKPGSERFIVDYMEAGARGYVSEDSSLPELGAALDQVARGEVVCSDKEAPFIFGRLASLRGRTIQPGQIESQILTAREREILELIARGLTNAQIGDRLSISVHTVKNHVHHILEKMKVSRRLRAVREAYGKKWLDAG